MRYRCIGGPYDGQWQDWGDRRDFLATVLSPPDVSVSPPTEMGEYQRVRYTLVEIRLAEHGSVGFWKPEDLSIPEAFAELLVGYAPHGGCRERVARDTTAAAEECSDEWYRIVWDDLTHIPPQHWPPRVSVRGQAQGNILLANYIERVGTPWREYRRIANIRLGGPYTSPMPEE